MFISVFLQALILFFLIAVGVLITKFGILNESTAKGMTDIILFVVTPCVIIKSFVREYSKETLKILIISFASAFVIHTVFAFISLMVFRNAEISRKSVLRFSMVFSNCGFMSLPLLQTIIGDDGVLIGASYIAVFNIFTWTYGIFIMSSKKKSIHLLKILYNPGIIGVITGITVFAFSIKIPSFIYEPISYISALNTPIPMLIIGYHIYNTRLLDAIKDRQCIIASVLRIIVFPVITVLGLRSFGINGNVLTALAISSCAPTAATTTMLAVKYGRAVDLSVKIVALTTVCSLITMPIIITITKYFS